MNYPNLANRRSARSISGTAPHLRWPELERNCPVCGKPTSHQVAFEKSGYSILRCGECRLGRTDVPAGFDPTAIYTDDYFNGGAADGYCDYVASAAVLRREFGRTLKQLTRVVPGGRLLEVGSAYGYFLDVAQPHFTCEGLEVCFGAVADCRRRGLNVTQGMVESVDLDARPPYDAVVLLDVIEHLPDPAATLANLTSHLAPGGALLITTGDWSSLLARWTGPSWRLMTPPQHLFFFSRGNLSALLRRLGLTVVHGARPWKLVPLGLAAYQAGRLCGLRWRLNALSGIGVPINLFDAVQIIARKPR